jgi:hypothetical protein
MIKNPSRFASFKARSMAEDPLTLAEEYLTRWLASFRGVVNRGLVAEFRLLQTTLGLT